MALSMLRVSIRAELLQPVETPQVQFLDKADMPVVCMTGAGFSRQFFCELTGVRARGLGRWR